MGTQTFAKKRKLVYAVGISVDHFIAREDGSVDGFLWDGPHAFDFLHSLNNYDAVLMGKNTYEWGFQYGAVPGEPSPVYPMMHYILSRTIENYQHERLRVIREDAAAFVGDLKQQSGKPIWLCGGGQLAGSLLDAELIDELILKVYPVTFGVGIPLFGNSHKSVGLSLIDARVYTNGAVFMRYSICYS